MPLGGRAVARSHGRTYPSQTIRPTIAGTPNDGVTAGRFPFTPSTTNTLGAFNGRSAIGAWSLYVRDDAGGDRRSFISISLQISSAVPEPPSWALMIGGFGMVGGMLRRRRRQLLAATA